MAEYLIQDSTLDAIANAINAKTGGSSAMTPSQMAAAIADITTGIEPQNLSWVQTPELVRNFLANVTYDPSDYSTSQITNYAPSTAADAQAASAPIGKTITVSAGTLIRDGFKQTVSAGDVTLYNDIPNVRTPYTVSNNGVVSQVGTLMPTHFLRQIKAATVNVRDIGGWACDGGTVRYGMIYRGGNPATADVDMFLNQLGILYELDLRGTAEAASSPSVLKDHIGYSVFGTYAWYSISNSPLWVQMLRVVFDAVNNGLPLFFHCAAGADRTGTLACILEALLGMSQSDIDKDYELTCFYTGTADDTAARRRNESEWSGLISAINAKNGSTFRDKVVGFVLSLGFSIDTINNFRSVMIDGNPEILVSTNYTVTNTLTNVSNSNAATTAEEYQPYTATLKPTPSYLIDSVVVTMGGADITSQVFSGTETERRFSVSENLSNCASDAAKTVVEGASFTAHLNADSGYTLTGATISITMGGVNVSQYYSNGTINIPSVTGNIVITATAVPSAPAYTNWIKQATAEIGGTALYNGTGYKNGYRYSSSMGESAQEGAFITGWIPVSAGDIVHLYGNIISGTGGSFNTQLADASGNNIYKFTPNAWSTTAAVVAHFQPATYDSTNNILSSFTVPSDGYMRFSLVGTFDDGTTVITINEEMS